MITAQTKDQHPRLGSLRLQVKTCKRRNAGGCSTVRCDQQDGSVC